MASQRTPSWNTLITSVGGQLAARILTKGSSKLQYYIFMERFKIYRFEAKLQAKIRASMRHFRPCKSVVQNLRTSTVKHAIFFAPFQAPVSVRLQCSHLHIKYNIHKRCRQYNYISTSNEPAYTCQNELAKRKGPHVQYACINIT